MDETNSVDINILFKEKEKIFGMIKKISDKNLQDRIHSFETPFSEIRQILIKMGAVLHKFIRDHFFKDYEDFEFYFWPGFTTIKNKRIFIWGLQTERANQHRYFTGIGWDKNQEKFYNCPTTLAFDQVLTKRNFEDCDFYPGSTHNFRINQSKDGIYGKEYLKLRVDFDNPEIKRAVFKALHVTTDKDYKEDKNSKHTIHIRISQEQIQNSGFIMKGCLDVFLKKHIYNSIEKNQYIWKWPFDALTYEEEMYKKNESVLTVDLCKAYQEKYINIQTHLYSYWIAETLGNENSFSNDTIKNSYKQDLHNILAKSNLF